MLLSVLSVCSEEELDTDSEDEVKEEKAAEEIRLRRQQIKNKIRAVGRMQRVFTLLRSVFLRYSLFLPFRFHFTPLLRIGLYPLTHFPSYLRLQQRGI